MGIDRRGGIMKKSIEDFFSCVLLFYILLLGLALTWLIYRPPTNEHPAPTENQERLCRRLFPFEKPDWDFFSCTHQGAINYKTNALLFKRFDEKKKGENGH
jgi:hypothetical protein